MRAVIYARFSTDMQREASIEDQVRICRRLIESKGWLVGEVYADMGMSGASHLRPGYQRLIEDARNGKFDAVVAESLDRISRDQEHIAGFHKQMSFRNVRIVTVGEGDITELQIGLKGTMSALFLKDLALKTHRGLEGRVRQGKAAGGLCYGYRVERQPLPDGTFTTGERSIVEVEAEIVRRIFREFIEGRSPRVIASSLNAEGEDGPRGGTWGPSTIYGNWRRGTGILANELYIGKLVWNRQKFVKDSSTGKRQARLNPPEEWVVEDVPDLRIIDDELWEATKARQRHTRHAVHDGTGATRPERAKRPHYLLSGLMKCGCCGGGFTLVGRDRYGCANARNRGTCDNRLTIARQDIEHMVLDGLKGRLLHPDLIAEFVAEYQAEYNRLMAQELTAKRRAEKELQKVQKGIADIVDAVAEGLYHPSMKQKMNDLEARRVELEAQLAANQEEPIRLHPGLSDAYREKVATLTEALNHEQTRGEAAAALRSLICEIRLAPEGAGLSVELVGELAAIMQLSENEKARTQGPGRSLTLVAGVGFEPTTFRL